MANTKAASTSIARLLFPYSDVVRDGNAQRKHIPMTQVLNSYPFLFEQPEFQPDSFFRFGVMRHPLDWIKSWYRYRKGNNVANPLAENLDFSAFWAQKDWNILHKDGTRYLQRHMFCSPHDEMLMDVIIPYHRLTDMFGDICDNLKVEGALTQMNTSLLNDTEIIPEKLQTEMLEFYAKDIELFEQLDQINTVGMEKLRRMER